jgi:hypothetical protein
MTKPVTTQDMFDLWQKMVNPGAYPLQSLMFPVLDVKEVEKKIAELETVEHWLKANLSMLQLTIKSLEYQHAMLKGGERAQAAMGEASDGGEMTNPALWAWNMMAQAGSDAAAAMGKMGQAAKTDGGDESPAAKKPRAKRRRAR